MENGIGKGRPMPNKYQYREDCAVLIIQRRNGETYEVLLDFQDVLTVAKYHWHAIGKKKWPYIRGRSSETGLKSVAIHQLIMGFPVGMVIDHINHNIHDNRRQNLRVITNGENQQNLKGARSYSSSGARGIHWCKRSNRWVGQVRVGGKCLYQRKFADLDKAIAAVTSARFELMPYTTN